MTSNVKIWTTIQRNLFDEMKEIGKELGYTDAELFRELIRRGLSSFRQIRDIKMNALQVKESGAILKAAEAIGESVELRNLAHKFKKGWD